MQRIIISSLFVLASSMASAALTSYTATKAGELSDPATYGQTVAPSSSSILWLAQNGNYTLNQNLAVAKIGTNWGNRNVEIVAVDAEGYEIEDPTQYTTLTIDGTAEANKLLIEMRSNSGANPENDLLSFKNGNIVFNAASEIEFSASTNSAGSAITKILEFQKATNVTIKNSIYTHGTSAALVDQSKYIFDGTTTLVDDSGNYKQISSSSTNIEIGGTFTAGVMNAWGTSKYTVKEGGTLIVKGYAAVGSTSSLTVNGTYEAVTLDVKAGSTGMTVNTGAKATMSDLFTSSSSTVIYGALQAKRSEVSAGTFTVKSGGTFTATSYFTNKADTIIEKGGTLNTVELYFSAGTTSVDGTLNQSTSSNITQNILISKGATLKLTSNGKLNVKGGYGNINLDGVLDVASGKNSFITPSNWGLRIRNGGKLILNSTDAFATSSTGSQANYVFWSYDGNTAIDILADNNFKSFALVSGANLTVTIGKNVNLITLNSFTSKLDSNCIDGLASDTASLTLEGFRENTIKIATVSAADKRNDGYLNIISTDWKNFYVDENGWLCATAVPEPATFAAIFGAMALALAVYRKKNS